MDIGDMNNIFGGYRATIGDFEYSWILEGCEGESMMVGEIIVYKSDSGGSTVDQGMSSNGLVAEGKLAQNHKMPSFHYHLRNWQTRQKHRRRQ